MIFRRLTFMLLSVLLLSSMIPFMQQPTPVSAISQDLGGALIAYIPNSNDPGYASLLDVFVRQGVKWVVYYDWPTTSKITQAKGKGLKTLIYVTGLKEPSSIISGMYLWPNGPHVQPQQSWAQYDVDSNGNPTGSSTYEYPATVGAKEIYLSPYGPYIDQVVLPRANHVMELGADGIFLDTLFMFWDSLDWGGTGLRYGGGESYSKVVWQSRYSGLSFLDFRLKATHDVIQRIYSTIAGRGVLVVSNNGINSESQCRNFASSIDQWQDVADGFLLEYAGDTVPPPDPPDILVHTWILYWRNVRGVTKPIWQLYWTNVDWEFKYMVNYANKIPSCGYWAYLPYIQQLDSAGGGVKKRTALTVDIIGSGSPGSVKLEGYLQNALDGTGLSGKTVHLRYALDKFAKSPNNLADVTTGSNGYYSYIWTPAGHPYNVTAVWDGDSNYNSWQAYDATYLAQAVQTPTAQGVQAPPAVYLVYNFQRYLIQGGVGGAVFNSYGLSSFMVRSDSWQDARMWPEQWATYPMQVGGTYYPILPAGYTLTGTQKLPPEAGLAPPTAPTSLAASMASGSAINLRWSYSGSGIDNFRIERKTGASGSYSEIATVPAGTTTHQDIGLAASTTYYYRVRAYRSSDDQYSAYSNEASATTDIQFKFTVSAATPNPQTITQGSSASYSLTVKTTQSTPQQVALTATNLPSGITIASFQSLVTPSSGSGTTLALTLKADTTAPIATYSNLYIQGSGGGWMAQSPIFTLIVKQGTGPPTINVPSSSLAENSLGRIFFLFNNKKYYITDPAAFNSYGLNWADVKTTPNPDTISNSQISYDYLLDAKLPLPNRPYIAGDVNDGSLYYIPYYTWGGMRYPISGAGYNAYGGYLKTLPIRYGDTALSLTISTTILDGTNPIPTATPPSFTIGENPLGRIFFIFNNEKYYFTNWTNYLSYGFTSSNIDPSINPDNIPTEAKVSFNYILEDTTSALRKPLPNQPYIAGDVNDGSLYWIPYYTWTGSKYSITGTGFTGYSGQLETLQIRYDDPAMSLSTSSYVLDGNNPIPTLIY